MKLNQKILKELLRKYPNIVVEELYEEHPEMGNYVCLTCYVERQNLIEHNGIIISEFAGDIYPFLNELNRFDIDKFYDDIFEDEKGEYEYVTFEW